MFIMFYICSLCIICELQKLISHIICLTPVLHLFFVIDFSHLSIGRYNISDIGQHLRWNDSILSIDFFFACTKFTLKVYILMRLTKASFAYVIILVDMSCPLNIVNMLLYFLRPFSSVADLDLFYEIKPHPFLNFLLYCIFYTAYNIKKTL